jgi:hypothetical protein
VGLSSQILQQHPFEPQVKHADAPRLFASGSDSATTGLAHQLVYEAVLAFPCGTAIDTVGSEIEAATIEPDFGSPFLTALALTVATADGWCYNPPNGD